MHVCVCARVRARVCVCVCVESLLNQNVCSFTQSKNYLDCNLDCNLDHNPEDVPVYTGHLKPAHTRAICLAKCHSCHFAQHIAPVCA